MLNPIRLFFGFKGRTGRLANCFGLFVLVAASPFSCGPVCSNDPFHEAVRLTQETGAAGLAWSLALLLLLEALNNKRLHDLGQSGLFGFLFYAPAAITAVTFFTDWRPAFDDALWCTRLAAWWFGAAGLWFLVRLGFYRGNRGENKFGPARR